MNNKASLKTLYRLFLRAHVENNYISKYKNALILGENFVKSCYIVLFEVKEIAESEINVKRFILIENIKNPILLELKIVPNSDGYITISKKHFNKNLPIKIVKKLANKGIASTIEIGLKTDKSFCWHRLVACLYYNCLEKEVHHIMSEDITCNDITNLIPVSKSFHTSLHNMDLSLSISLAREEQSVLRRKYYIEKQTIASNAELIFQILKLKNDGIKPNQIIKKVKKSIKKSKVYEILSIFYYSKSFIEWLKTQENKEFTELYGNLSKSWIKILEFEDYQKHCWQEKEQEKIKIL